LPKETFTDGHKVSDNIVQPKPEAEEEKIVIHKPEMKSWAFTTSGHSRGVTRTEDLTAALNAGLVHRPQVSDVDNLLHDDHVIEWKGFSDDITSVADSFAAIMGENPHQKSQLYQSVHGVTFWKLGIWRPQLRGLNFINK